MPATFARTTDRPRLFDPSPRARRPTRPIPDREVRDPGRAPVDPDRDVRDPGRAPVDPARDAPADDLFAPVRDRDTREPDRPVRADEPASPAPSLAPHAERPADADPPRHALTLDQLISGVWDELVAHRTVTCPVCHGQMAPRYGSGAHPVGGRCRRCGSSLG